MEPKQIIASLINNIETVIVGKRDIIKLCLAALISKGHILIEDVPGLGKTMLARAIAKSINADFRRLQFTPDLLPSDITGVSVYNQKTQEFEPRQGPIFANIVLADEINRTTPRTQSGLLECMQESRVTIDGVSYSLPQPFFVMATQNPIEFHGTYPLPEAQMDRFLMQIGVGYPSQEGEAMILNKQLKGHPIEKINSVATLEQVIALQEKAMTVHISKDLIEFITNIVRATRLHPDVSLGSSPRGSLALMQVSRAMSLLEGRDFVTPDDIKNMSFYALGHRIVLKTEAQVEGRTKKKVIEEVLRSVVVPL
ncbi:MAG: MoxR family ATPase [Candidatus Omnitrophica bacterium]|nr:MoxR family ATPase [Candidatus Omnitrophota bacterium]MBU4478936.1 MoxR family ATPase [Candidatus Omnitrophota bacterium]MCG2704394.1 MoxR family ATPase [Candidatus Omnitrophota bacterium]